MQNHSIQEFIEYFDRIRSRTMRLVECIPPQYLEWSPRDGAFTFGDIIRHLACIERYMYAENIQGNPSLYAGCGREYADGYEQVSAFIRRLHEESRHIFLQLSDDDMIRLCKTPSSGSSIPIWKWLRAMVEHEAHHRGQMYTYLRILDIPTPPIFGLTSEEVAARCGEK